MKIVLTGASGYLGRVLAPFLAAQGHDLVLISRSSPDYPLPKTARFLPWDGQTLGDWAREFEGADAVVNMAGRSVNCRHNEENRRLILGSRVDTTRVVGEAIAQVKNSPRVWLNAASAAIYHQEWERGMDEATGILGEGFSVEVCKAWEKTLFERELPQTRRVAMRISLIFGPSAPVFQVFERLTKLFLGGPQGNGKQFVSWIHERDCLRAIEWLLQNETLSGPVNLCAPNPLPNRDFTRVLRQVLHRPIGLPAPTLAMKIGAIFLRTESELALNSRRVVPKKLLDAGFQFDFSTWSDAAENIVSQQ